MLSHLLDQKINFTGYLKLKNLWDFKDLYFLANLLRFWIEFDPIEDGRRLVYQIF